MTNIKIVLEYDGTNYFGWQRQKEGGRLPTIQSVLEKTLQRIFNKKVSVTASGRTDTGVHAFSQVVSFKVNTEIPKQNILRALNTYLPRDIVTKQIEEVPLSFNARFSAKKKWYRYTLINKKLPSVFNRFYAVHYPYPLDIKLMRKAGNIVKGRHNFSAIVLGEEKKKIIYKLSVKKEENFIYIDIIGDGFLYKMVRRIVGVLMDIGRGKIKIEDARRLVSGKKISQEIQTAPAKGLSLIRVYYNSWK